MTENEPAFPTKLGAGVFEHQHDGMSLRDWFAGMALAGRMARNSHYETWVDAAKDAFEVADAMLAARKETSND